MCFFASPGKLAIVWLTIFHLPRGLLGFCLLKFLPRSHDIVQDLDFDEIQGNLTIEKLYERIKFSLSVQFMNQAQASRFWMLGYSVSTAVCYLFDGICFIYAFKKFSEAGNEYAELLLLMATLLNFTIDVYYFIWVINLKQKLPPKIGSFVSDAILGYTQKMTRELYQGLDRGARSSVEGARKKLSDVKEEAKQEAANAK